MLATWGCTTFPKPTLSLDFLGATSLDSGITFSRGSQATLFDSTGTLVYAKHNLVLQSQDFATSWTPLGSSVAQNSTSAPDATNTADTLTEDTSTGEHRIASSSVTWQGNRQYTASVYIKANGRTRVDILFGTAGNWVNGDPARSANFDLTTGTVAVAPISPASASIQDVGNGWYRCQLTVTSVTSPSASSVFIRICDATGSANYTGNGTSGLFLWGAQLNLANMEGGVTSSLTTYYPTTTAAYYAPRFDYNPSTLQPRGLLIEEQRTNSIRNNTMQGAVAGTPGTLPTNWITIGAGIGTLTQQIVGTGTSNGITYIDVRISGTTSTVSFGISPESNTQISAASGQNWTSSIYLARVGGTTSNLTISQRVVERNGAGGGVGNTATNITSSLGTSLSRFSVTRTLADATTAFVTTDVLFEFLAGVAIDITLRIGLPQLEQGAFATSVIPTTTTALTRNADVASMTGTNFSSWYNQSEGTLLAQVIYNADTSCKVVFITDGTYNNIFSLQREGFLDRWQTDIFSAASRQALLNFATNSASVGSVSKCASVYKVNDFAGSANGGAVITDTSGLVQASVDRLALGRDNVGSVEFLNGYIQRISYYPVRLPNSTLQALTA